MLTVVRVYPQLLGTYGDGGNAEVLGHRAERRGIAAEVVDVPPGSPVPRGADIYVVGGGEDTAQLQAVTMLREDGGFAAALSAGASCLAVCASFQLLGEWFELADGARVAGLGLLDAHSPRLASRAVGDIVLRATALELPDVIGYENHGGGCELGADAQPLGVVRRGVGNDGRVDGAVQGHIVATYLHGPVLARNPALADVMLGWATGAPLAPLDDELVERLRSHQLGELRRRRGFPWPGRGRHRATRYYSA